VSAYSQKLGRLRESLRERGAAGLGLSKATSNLFRDSANAPRPSIDLSGFNQVIAVDPVAGTLECEGMTTYADLADATLAVGVMPCVVPELKSITLGGAAAGVGIESSSFRYGLVHETLLAMDVLLGDGRIVTCTPDNEHRELFFGFPNSYGTLGYALRLSAKTVPVKRYVRLEHIRHSDGRSYFEDLARHCGGDADFVDGTVFSAGEMYITLGRFVDEAPWMSDYGFERIYYRSIREKTQDYLAVRDYIWRWDTDWFWCSKNVFAQNPLIRRLYGRNRLNSSTYSRIMRWNSRVGLTRALARLSGKHPESIIQDVDIPIERSAEFLGFLLREIGILPIWICPVRAHAPVRFPLYPLDSATLYVNFGFWDVVNDRVRRPPGFRNRAIEIKAGELGGIKSLYSASYFPEDEFWRIYNGGVFRSLKRRYDPQNALRDLYQKCVLRYRGAAERARDDSRG
jgi:FAD/FMN-containing dehydrogenase